MSKDASLGAKLQDHPVLSKLIREGAPDSMTFWGYVGPSRKEGVVTLSQPRKPRRQHRDRWQTSSVGMFGDSSPL